MLKLDRKVNEMLSRFLLEQGSKFQETLPEVLKRQPQKMLPKPVGRGAQGVKRISAAVDSSDETQEENKHLHQFLFG